MKLTTKLTFTKLRNNTAHINVKQNINIEIVVSKVQLKL